MTDAEAIVNSQERIANILRGIMSSMLILAVFFLGFNAAHWTNEQIQQYCVVYNNATFDVWQSEMMKNFTMPAFGTTSTSLPGSIFGNSVCIPVGCPLSCKYYTINESGVLRNVTSGTCIMNMTMCYKCYNRSQVVGEGMT